MFVSVKNLTASIEQNIQFYIEGVASKERLFRRQRLL